MHEMYLSFKSDVVAGACPLAKNDVVYPVENELLFDFLLTAKTPHGTYFVKRRQSKIMPTAQAGPPRPVVVPDAKEPRAFSDADRAYIFEHVDEFQFPDIMLNRKSLQLTLTIRIWWKRFFKEMLEHLTRRQGDTFNFARTPARAAIESSFTKTPRAGSFKIDYADDKIEFKDIPCSLVNDEAIVLDEYVDPAITHQKLLVRMDLDKLPARDHRNVALTLIAADWTKLYQRKTKFDKGRDTLRPSPWYQTNAAPTGDERALQTWECNIARYLFTHASLQRGQTILDEIIAAASTPTAKAQPVLATIKQIRDDIDARLITANHWGDLRENPATEPYQKNLSDLFGEMHQDHWYASPVRFTRAISGVAIEVDTQLGTFEQKRLLGIPDAIKFEEARAVQLILQFGVGHCGEHASVSYYVVKQLIDDGAEAKFVGAISTGNANIDHAFVIGGFQLQDVITTTNHKAFSPGGLGKAVTLIDLGAAVSAPGHMGWVLDPYLDAPARTTNELLRNISNKKARGEKATTFLRYLGQHKAPPKLFTFDLPDGVEGV